MGSDLLERMQRAGLEAAGQRRNVTILFADLSGYTALSTQIDGEDLFDIIQQYFGLLSNCVYKYEGIVDKFTGDGIMALFGAPISHENNAERAVRAALDMQTEITQFSRNLKARLGVNIHARIGLHSGSVVVGGIGSNMMMNYTAIGDTVNLAHRIEEAAPPGAILVSETVYRQVRTFFDCQQISILNAKGIPHPVVAYRVLDFRVNPGVSRGLEGLRAPMIGRDLELERLKHAVESLNSEKKGQFAFITGDAGLGKSRLTFELKGKLDFGTVRLLQGQSLAYRRTISYWIIREILYSLLGLHPNSAAVAQISERLGRIVYQAMGAFAEDAMPYLENLLALPYSDLAVAEKLKHIDARQLRQQTFLAVRDLLIHESQKRPILIVMDDLHWADDASLELMLFLLQSIRQAPIFIIAISRTVLAGPLEKAVHWAQENLAERFINISLQGLSPDQSDQLLLLLLAIPDLPEKIRQQIVQRAAGVPLYLEEILRMLIDHGIIQNENGRWQVQPGADMSSLGVPDTLQELILARFDRLTNTQRLVLQVAAVIGKDFSLPVLSQLLQPLDIQALRVTVDSLVEREFISPMPGNPDTEFTFKHILMSDAIYGTILRKERSAIHGQVAEVLETTHADRLDDMVELLANHYRWSPRADKALSYLILAGQKAANNYANDQALSHYRAAQELLPQLDSPAYPSFQVHMGIADVLAFVGEYQEARQDYQQALKIVSSSNEGVYAEEISLLYRKIARTYERLGDYDQALLDLDTAMQILESSRLPHRVEKAEVWHDVGWIHFRRGNFVDADSFLKQALELVENSEAYGVIASIYNRLGGIAMNQGDWDQAVHYLRRSIDIRESIGDLAGLSSSSNNLGYLEIEMGEFDSALQDLTRNYDLVKRLGQVEGIAIALNNLGWLHILRGELAEAMQALSQSLDLADQIGYSSLKREVLKNIGELHLNQESWSEAKSVLSEVAKNFEELGAHDQLLQVYRLLGEAELEDGDLAQALICSARLDNLVEGNEEEIPALQRGEMLRFKARLAIKQLDIQSARRLLEQSEDVFKKLRSRLYLGKTIYQYGVLAETEGEYRHAQACFSEAATLFENIGARLEAQRAKDAFHRLEIAG